MADETMNGPLAPTSGNPMTDDQQVKPDPTQLDADKSKQGPEQDTQQPVQQSVTVTSQPPDQAQTDNGDNSSSGLKDTIPEQKVAPLQMPAKPDPGVVQATRLNKIATVLSGGPHFTTSLDPVTGKVTRTQNQVSTKSLLLAVAMEALGGATAGLAQHGPGNEGKALAAGYASGQANAEQAMQAQSDQDKQASSDLARQAAITTTNFQTHMNAMKAGGLDYDAHKQWVADGAPIVENIQKTGAALASGVSESDLTNKYHVTRDMAMPDGVVPRIGADGQQAKNSDGSLAWDNTYTVIDPTAKIQLPEDTAKLLAEYRVPGAFKIVDGKAVPQDFVGSAPIKAAIVVDMMQKASGIKLTQAQFDQQLKAINDPQDEQKFEVNLKNALADGSLTTKGIQTIGKYAGIPLDQVAATMQKDKVPADIIGQFMSLVPQGAIEKAKISRTNQEADAKAAETSKNLVVSKTNYLDVLANKQQYSKEQVAAAVKMESMERSNESSKAYATGRAGEQGRIDAKKANGIPLSGGGAAGDDNLSHPELAGLVADDKNYDTPTGTNEKFLQAMMQTDPERARLIKAYADGLDMTSLYASAKKFGGSLLADIHAYDKSFNGSKIREYDKLQNDMSPAGKIGKSNTNGSTAFVHLNNMVKSIGLGSYTGTSGEFDASAAQATQEQAGFYAGGYKAGEHELQDYRTAFHSKVPGKAHSAAVQAGKNMMDKMKAQYDTYDNELPRGIPRTGFIDAAGADAYKQLTGEPVEPKLLRRPQGAVHTGTGSQDGKLHWLSATGHDLGVVPGQ